MARTLEEARKEFFKDCQFLARAPGSYFLGGEHVVMYGQLAVIHAIPLYAYVGIEPAKDSI
jgi:mevalonate kinase